MSDERVCTVCERGGLPPRARKHDECLTPKPTRRGSAPRVDLPPVPDVAPPGYCPTCRVVPLEGRQRRCDSCVEGVAVDRSLTVAPVRTQQLAVVPVLVAVGPRPVEVSCLHVVHLDGRWWQGDDYQCPEHGPAWVVRVSREAVPA